MYLLSLGFPDSLVGKEPAAMQETLVQILGLEDPLEKGITPEYTLVFWPGEFHGLQSMGSQRVGHD